MAHRFSPLRATALALSLSLTGCVIDPNAFPTYPPGSDTDQSGSQQRPAPERKLVKSIGYSRGDVSYFRTSNSTKVAPDKVRICLENNTGQPKMMQWSRIQSGVNNLNTPRNGDTSCATLNLNQRVEWTFMDRSIPVKRDGMNLSSFGGSLVEFIWVRDY